MNIVKGVADLIRRSSGGQAGEAGSSVNVDKFSPPSPRIIFGDAGEEAVLAVLWRRYENAIDKEEKRKSLQVFLLQFLESYKSWKPIQNDQSTEEQSSRSEEIIVGCTIGHPSDVILILIQEIAWITSLVTQWNISAGQVNIESSEPPSNSDFAMENFYVLDCLTIITRSMHNCKVFSYYSGVQKITALLKAAVIKLKTFTSVLSLDESLSSSSIEKTSTLQKMLTRVVLIIFTFIELHPFGAKNTLVVDTFIQPYPWNNQLEFSSSGKINSASDKRFFWHRKAIILVMEAGGVNWLVELLRTIRRLNLKEQWTDLSVHYLTLGTLKSTLSENSRAQNHFRSIGGLEVLLDGLGLPSSSFSLSKTTSLSEDERNGILQLQILSLEVLRESTFGNINNMQFLCENGRIHKFANNICWPVFMLQELYSTVSHSQLLKSNSVNASEEIASPGPSNQYYVDAAILSEWNSYSIKLSRALCSFLLAPEDSKFFHDQTSVGRSSLSISLAYWDLSVRWIMRVLHTIFPCIKACVGGNVLSEHIRILATTLQHYILCAFRMVLVSAPTLLQVFRNEGLWDLIFSEKFFYFGPSLLNTRNVECKEGFSVNSDMPSAIQLNKDLSNSTGFDTIQEEAIFFLEYVATFSGNTNNLPECSVFLDTLEESACDPKVASIILKGLRRILQLAVKQSLASFNSLNVIARVLNVSCIQAQEFRKNQCSCIPAKYGLPEESSDSTSTMADEQTNSLVNCMESAFDLFSEYLDVAENGLYLVLINFSCIESLFDLFWEKSLQKHVLEIILRLLKVSPSSEEDDTAKLQLCSKFLETFTRAKERESSFMELSLDLLVSIKELILTDRQYYQNLFRNGECFLHIVSLLNGSLDETLGEQLVLNVLETLTLLLTGNDDSKFAFRALVGSGYQTLQSLLLDICKSQPSKGLLDAVYSMLVDGKCDEKEKAVIKNEDVIVLFLSILEKSDYSLQHYGLDLLLNLLKDSISNRTACCRSGVLSSLLDWFHREDRDNMITKIIHLIQIVGGHSISGKDIRKIFALLRSGNIASRHSSLLLASLGYMLKEKGPAAFFEFSGSDSGIIVKTPIQWPSYRGFSFSCWLRVEDFHDDSMMGLFSFLTDNGKGCLAMIAKDKLIFQSINQKRQSVQLALNIDSKKWHFLCITHSIGRAFSGGSQLKCYVDGVLISSEKCSYAKVSELMTRCTIGTELKPIHEEPIPFNLRKTLPFFGQIGPIYTFCDVLTPEQIKGIYCLGPSYMYSFLGNEILLSSDNLMYSGVLDAKDGFSSKILFGLSAQASYRGTLFNVSSMVETSLDDFQAIMTDGTKLCSRRLLQEIIYCVGGVSVFFPLLTQFQGSLANNEQLDRVLVKPIANDNIVAEVIELVASILDGNVSNQQQMHLLSGFSILGFLLQTVPPQQLNAETLSALKYMFYVVKNSGMSEMLVKDLILWVYLNPRIWVYANYEVQRDLYLFLIQNYEGDRSLLPSLCALPRIIDVICQFYWDKIGRTAFGNKHLLSSAAKEIIGERPGQEEAHKLRLLLLSLAEMSLREKVSPSDIKALIAFFERSQDMACIEDVLHMIIRALSQKPLLSSFLEQANLVGGCYICINLLKRDLEPIRLLGLQFLGSLLIGFPSEKKGTKFFSLSVGRSKSLPESFRKGGSLRTEPVFVAISERIFKFPLSDNLYATLFDLLLGGASPKQVLQKHTLDMPNRRINSSGVSSHFVLPQILTCIFKYLAICTDSLTRGKIIGDLLDLLDSNASNIEALQEHCWVSWLETSVILDAVKNYEVERKAQGDSSKLNELLLIRNMYCIILSHYLYSVKGGWQQLEETINFLVLKCKQGELSHPGFLRDILEDLIGSMVEIPSEENIFISQPCRDNTLYLLKVVNELLINETGIDFLFPGIGFSSGLSENISLEIQKDISSAVIETLKVEGERFERIPWNRAPVFEHEEEMKDGWWNLYDKTWILVNALNGKGPGKMLPKALSIGAPSFGQRARGLVESLNIPAAEMAAVVVSGGIGSTLSGKTNKFVDKAILLRGEKCPRIVFHLVILYLCKAGLESASRCVQQFLFLLPSFVQADDDHNKNRIHFFIWSLLAVRLKFSTLDDGARFHVITHMILEIVNSVKAILATGIVGRDDPIEVSSNMKEAGFILNLIQRDRVLTAAIDEAKYMNIVNADRSKQLQELRTKLDEYSSGALRQWKNFEDELQSDINSVIAADDNRKATFQLSHDEDQQTIADKWIHRFRALIDERGPWSSNPFPNNVITHWKLDKTEDLWRRRPKLKRNYQFDERLCHPPVAKPGKDGSRIASEPCADSGTNHPGQVKPFHLKGVRGITEEVDSEPCDETTDKTLLNDSDFNSYSENSELNIVKDYGDPGNIAQDNKEWTYDSGDNDSSEVHLSVPSVLITPKRKLAGHLAVLQDALHFSGEFLVEGTAGASVFKSFQELGNLDSSKTEQKQQKFLSSISETDRGKGSTMDSSDQNALLRGRPTKVKRHRRWKLSKIKSVHWTRYLLQYTAIEIFFNDSTAPVFLNFESQKDAKSVGTLVVSLRNEILQPKGSSRDRSGMISFVDRRAALELAENARESWRRREISNFEYIMILNTLSGRSYNDLTQYPVFPWVLADYSSEKLDFNKSSTFRDLTKPVGALDQKRFEVFEDRYRNFSDPDIPSFYYGSHYSSMGIVLYYLIRLEPFTALHRHLQGGKFDHADRLFQSIDSTYRNCLTNTSDVKELIPEFFYLPDFLVNSNSYHLGVKQDGEPLGDVVLPPWAKGSPEKFIYQNREALESEYVSSNLHHWIDLVFGYKQRGKPSMEAANIFYYLTYEGAVDLDTMDDILQKSAIEDQIANFGQTPIQIFRKKHPRRGPPIPIAHPLTFAPGSITLTSAISNTISSSSAVLFVGLLDSNIILVNKALNLSIKLWLTTQLQAVGNFTFSGSQEPFFGIGSDVLPPRKIGTHLAENIDFGRQCMATMEVLSESYLISCGNWENSFQVISLSDGRIIQSIRQHKDVVSCVAVSSDGSILATGSHDTTVMVWHTCRGRLSERRSRYVQSEFARRDHVVMESPFHILCGHDDVITCLFISTELDIVISGSKDGTCIFHTLRQGRYVHSIQHPSGIALSKLVVSQHGRLVIYGDNDLSLHMYSINGKHLASSECNGRLNCIELSTCGDFLVCAGDQGQISLRSMHSLEVIRRYDGVGKIITSLAVTPEECFLAGTKDGSLLVYSFENPLFRRPSLSRSSKSKSTAVG